MGDASWHALGNNLDNLDNLGNQNGANVAAAGIFAASGRSFRAQLESDS